MPPSGSVTRKSGAPGRSSLVERQYLHESLIDELHVAISPILLGRGEPLFAGVDLPALGYECTEFQASDKASHVVIRRTSQRSN